MSYNESISIQSMIGGCEDILQPILDFGFKMKVSRKHRMVMAFKSNIPKGSNVDSEYDDIHISIDRYHTGEDMRDKYMGWNLPDNDLLIDVRDYIIHLNNYVSEFGYNLKVYLRPIYSATDSMSIEECDKRKPVMFYSMDIELSKPSHIKIKAFESKETSRMKVLKDLSIELQDAGLDVKVSTEDDRFHFKDSIYLVVDDVDKVFCKKYPEDDMDWLHNKPIMLDFYKRIEDFGMIRDKDWKLYGGGLSVTLIFDNKGKSIPNIFK